MPITSPVSFPRLTAAEMREIDYEVMKHAFDIHRELGRLCDERIYQADLAARLRQARREMQVCVSFQSFSKSYELDLVVADRVIYELKSVEALTPGHDAQLLNHLLLTNSTRGKLLNFRGASVDSRFINTSLDHSERRRFTVHTDRWSGGDDLHDLTISILEDWGTGLETSLYLQAIVQLSGGGDGVPQQVDMQRNGLMLGNQRFHLMGPQSCVFVTTLASDRSASHEAHLRLLLNHSPLSRAHWINIDLHEIHFVTLVAKP